METEDRPDLLAPEQTAQDQTTTPPNGQEEPPRKGVALHWTRMILSMVVGLAVGVAVILLVNPHVQQDIETAVTATRAPGFLLLALAVTGVILIVDAWSLVELMRVVRPDASGWRVTGITFEANLVGGATSFGGLEIPYQVVALRLMGMTVSQATSAIVVKGVIHATVLVIAALVAASIPVAGSPITPLQRWILLGVLGFLLLVWILGTIWVRKPLGLSLFPNFIRKRLTSFVDALAVFRTMGWSCLVRVTGLQIVYWVGMFSLIPLVLLSLGYRGSLLPTVVGQAVVQVLMPLSPLPGGAGVAEWGYMTLIGPQVPNNIRVASLIIWRVLTWLIPVALGGLAIGLRGIKRRK